MSADLPEVMMQDSLRSRTGGGSAKSLTSTGVVAVRGDTPPPGFTRDLGLKLPGISNKVREALLCTTFTFFLFCVPAKKPEKGIHVFFFFKRMTTKSNGV